MSLHFHAGIAADISLLSLYSDYFGATLTFQLSRFIYWDDCSNVSAFQKVKKYLLAFLMWPCIICMGVLLWQYIMIIAWCVRNRTYGEYKIPDVRLIVFYSLRNYIHGIAQMLKWELQRQILDSQEEQICLWPVLKVPMWLMWVYFFENLSPKPPQCGFCLC